MRHAPHSSFTPAIPVTPSPAAASVTGLAAFGACLMWVLGLPGRIAATRRDMALLGRMSACELADIGLSRQDVWDATALPLGQSPGPLFRRRVAERRRAALSRRH